MEEVNNFIKEVMEKWSCIDILVNNVGIICDILLFWMKLEEW